MITKEIANRLVTLCRENEFEKAQKELYAEDAISIEPRETPDFAKETKGLKDIVEKEHKFTDRTEAVFSTDVSEPMIACNAFSTVLTMNIKMKGMDRMEMKELCVYKVADGKIKKESFFM